MPIVDIQLGRWITEAERSFELITEEFDWLQYQITSLIIGNEASLNSDSDEYALYAHHKTSQYHTIHTQTSEYHKIHMKTREYRQRAHFITDA